MIQSLLEFIGLVQADIYVPDSVYFVVLSSIFLFAVAETMQSLWSAMGTWGVIGFFFIALPILYKVVRLARKLINF